jgi:hypothetical protein
MATYGTMKTRLQLLLAGSSHMTLTDIGTLVNRVHQEEVENHAWQRLKITTALNTVAPVTTGTVSINQGATAVTGSGTAFAAGDVGKYIRIDGDHTPLKVTAYSSATAITVGTAWAKANVSAVAYSLFPLRYALPATAQSVNWIARGRPLIETTIDDLTASDPDRLSTADQATHWAPAEQGSTDLYQVELWPVASAPVAYMVEYLKGHTALSADGDTPLVPSGVIENKAMYDCTMALFLKTGEQKFMAAAASFWSRYQSELTEAIIRDRKRYGAPTTLERAVALPYDYLSLHDME